MTHPFADLLDLSVDTQEDGHSECSLQCHEKLLNPHGVMHGAAVFSLADTGMGSALYPSLDEGQICATIEIKINYYRPITSGKVICITEVINRGKRIANMESSIYCEDILVAKANGNYSIFTPGKTIK